MLQVLQGIVRGGKIELIDGPKLADGQRVQIMLEPQPVPAGPDPECPTFEEGVIHTPASPALIKLLDNIRRTRRAISPSPTGPGRRSSAGRLADDPAWDEHLHEILESRKSDAYREPPE